MSSIHLTTWALPCCQNLYDQETKVSIYLRITAVVLGVLIVIGGVLILYNAFGMGQLLDTRRGWGAVVIGVLFGLQGVVFKHVKRAVPAAPSLQALVKEYKALVTKQIAEIIEMDQRDALVQQDIEEAHKEVSGTLILMKTKLNSDSPSKLPPEQTTVSQEAAEFQAGKDKLKELRENYPKPPSRRNISEGTVRQVIESNRQHHEKVIEAYDLLLEAKARFLGDTKQLLTKSQSLLREMSQDT